MKIQEYPGDCSHNVIPEVRGSTHIPHFAEKATARDGRCGGLIARFRSEGSVRDNVLHGLMSASR